MIYLKKNGIFRDNDYGPDCEDYIYEEVKSVIPHLNSGIKVDDDFTFKDLFKIIEDDKEMFDIVFSSHLGNYPIQCFIDDINTPKEVDDDEKIDYLLVSKYIEVFNHLKYYEKHKDDPPMSGLFADWYQERPENDDSDISIFTGISGIAEAKDIPYGIGCCSLYELKDLPLKIEKKMRIYDSNENSTVYEGELDVFSVFDFFGTILDEISFYGSPVEKDVTLEELNEEFKNIEDMRVFENIIKCDIEELLDDKD